MNATLPAPAARPRMPRWIWAIVALFAVAVLAAVAVAGWVSAFDLSPVRVVIDGTEHVSFDLATLGTGEKLAIAVGVLVALLVALIVVPLALLIGLAAVAVGLVLGLGVPLIVGLLVLLLAMSPLLLIVALAWWLWRRSSGSPADADYDRLMSRPAAPKANSGVRSTEDAQ